MLTELTKAAISFTLYFFVFRTDENAFFRKRATWFAVPAVMYSLWYIVNFAALENTSFPVYMILYQVNVLVLPIVWNMAFKKGAQRPRGCGAAILTR